MQFYLLQKTALFESSHPSAEDRENYNQNLAGKDSFLCKK